MNASTFDQRLEQLQANVEALLKAYQRQAEENAVLTQERQVLKQRIDDLETKLSDFQNQDKMSKLVNNTSVEKEDSIELKNRLNEYIKEIDKCISYLS